MKTRTYYTVKVKDKNGKEKTHCLMLSELNVLAQIIKDHSRASVERTECSEASFKTIFQIP